MAKTSGPARTSNTSSSPTWPSKVSPVNSDNSMPSVRSGPAGAACSSAICYAPKNLLCFQGSTAFRGACHATQVRNEERLPASGTSANLAPRQLPVRPHEVAGIPVGQSFKVVLVFGFGLPEVSHRDDFGSRLAGPEPRGVDVGDGIDRDALLFVTGEEDRRPVARPDVVALPVARARIVDLEEKLEDFPEARDPRIENDLDRLGVRAVVTVGCVRHVASGVSDAGGEHAALAPDQILHAPEAAARQY